LRVGLCSGVELTSDEYGDLSSSVVWRGDDEWSGEVREIRSELLQGKKLSHSEIRFRLKTLKLVDKKVYNNPPSVRVFTVV